MACTLHRLLVLALLFATAGCNRHVYSPPARVLPIETARTARADVTGVAIDTGPSGALFGPSLWSGTGRVRRSVAPGTDVVAEGTVLVVTSTDDDEGVTAPHRGVYVLRAGVKHELAQHFALVGGLGGGASTAGGFVSPDAGAVASWENPYVVPFVSARGYLSQPVGASAVDLRGANEGERYNRPPELTVGLNLAAGVRVPLGPRHEEAGAIGAAFGLTGMRDSFEDQTFGSGAIGGELWF